METYGDQVWGMIGNTSINSVELPVELQRMTDIDVKTIRVYPDTILVNSNVGPNTIINTQDTTNFKNPAINVTNEYIDTCTTIQNLANVTASLIDIVTACNSSIEKATTYLNHTNRISGTYKIGTIESESDDPWLVPAAEAGRAIAYLNYISTGSTNVSFQNVFSSVFASTISLLEAQVSNAVAVIQIVENSLTEIEPGVYVSDLTSQEISDCVYTVSLPGNTMETRRTNDKVEYSGELDGNSNKSGVGGIVNNSYDQIMLSLQSNMKY